LERVSSRTRGCSAAACSTMDVTTSLAQQRGVRSGSGRTPAPHVEDARGTRRVAVGIRGVGGDRRSPERALMWSWRSEASPAAGREPRSAPTAAQPCRTRCLLRYAHGCWRRCRVSPSTHSSANLFVVGAGRSATVAPRCTPIQRAQPADVNRSRPVGGARHHLGLQHRSIPGGSPLGWIGAVVRPPVRVLNCAAGSRGLGSVGC